MERDAFPNASFRTLPTPKALASKDLIAKLEDMLRQARAGELIGMVVNVRWADTAKEGSGCTTYLAGETHYLEQIGQLELAKTDLINRSRAP